MEGKFELHYIPKISENNHFMTRVAYISPSNLGNKDDDGKSMLTNKLTLSEIDNAISALIKELVKIGEEAKKELGKK